MQRQTPKPTDSLSLEVPKPTTPQYCHLASLTGSTCHRPILTSMGFMLICCPTQFPPLTFNHAPHLDFHSFSPHLGFTTGTPEPDSSHTQSTMGSVRVSAMDDLIGRRNQAQSTPTIYFFFFGSDPHQPKSNYNFMELKKISVHLKSLFKVIALLQTSHIPYRSL